VETFTIVLGAHGVIKVKRKRRKLKSSAAYEKTASQNDQGLVIPIRWLKQLVAVFLLPVAWILTRAFFCSFSQATINHAFWVSEEFWFFSLGAILWLIAFVGLPKPMVMYVFGHELTHAIWVLIMGGKVREFRIGRDGGHIVTDTTNFWIALAPYFCPIYSVVILGIYGGVGLFVDLEPYHRWLFGCVGFTWMFHITFTLWMLWNGQTDLIEHGTFFSMMVIYLMNFLVLSLMLIVASRDVTFVYFGKELLAGAIDFSDGVVRLFSAK
jgi:hypothetical protein